MTSEPERGGGCPIDVGALAAGFDPFGPEYQLDPAEALRWSRDQLPIFFAPSLGYWVVSRYADIKAVFRDPLTFSPRNVLERITPPTQEALEILADCGYAMNRTLVNEDEPIHMQRRRLLLDHFLPANLETHQEMIRRLTREKIDGFIDMGRVELVDAMLYEVPLLVALHFLGVPEDEIATLKTFSLAHSVNTWGRPTPEKQRQVAQDVGRFWKYAGAVIERMRAEPDGKGWMHHTIRMNAKHPEIVTESYVHSMMMAIIVAAHETTSLASANMFRTLLTHRDAWEDICANPALIPNAVEECLRYAGSIVAWRRETTRTVTLGDVALPEGAKLLIVQASGNRDGRQFENGDAFDIYRDNAVEHLTFGYGAHQCMGKNIGRMEMRIFLQEMTCRLPHLRLAEQEFSHLPNISFRGPKALWVEWDPAQNPERVAPARRETIRNYPVGAPARRDIARRVRVNAIRREAEGVFGVTLADIHGRPLPPWTPGAHVEICLGAFERKYSLCGHAGSGTYNVAIKREEPGRGGSRYLCDTLTPGTELRLRGPSNHFQLADTGGHHMLVAGGIGITPILAMADRLRAQGRPYHIHYAGRDRASMAFLTRLDRDHGDLLSVYPRDEGARLDLATLVRDLPDGGKIYACGPERMLHALENLTEDLPEGTLKIEHFSATRAGLDPTREIAFEIELAHSELVLPVGADSTVLDALLAAGIDLPHDCCEGLCGSCEIEVIAGEIDHRDAVLTRAERGKNTRMMACCSRSKAGARLRLAL